MGELNNDCLHQCRWLYHVHHVQHCFYGVVRKRRVGHTMALSWGLLSVLIFGMVGTEGWISQKAHFLARNK